MEFNLSHTSPVGSVQMFAGSSAPDGWLMCNGDAISRTTYSDLFSVIGTLYGSGDGSTTFNLPNTSERVPQTKPGNIGSCGGNKNINPTGSVGSTHASGSNAYCSPAPASHEHYMDTGNIHGVHNSHGGQSYSLGAVGFNDAGCGSLKSAGGGSYHTHGFNGCQFNRSFSGSSINIEQPYLVISFIIKYATGEFV